MQVRVILKLKVLDNNTCVNRLQGMHIALKIKQTYTLSLVG